jgi:hypothetical protein
MAPVNTWSFWANNGSMIILASIITGWLFNRSKGSILVAGIVHAADNTPITRRYTGYRNTTPNLRLEPLGLRRRLAKVAGSAMGSVGRVPGDRVTRRLSRQTGGSGPMDRHGINDARRAA